MANDRPWADAPVFVDASAGGQDTPIVRVTYLTIECAVPTWNWSLSIQDEQMPIGLLGLTAVVLRPFGDGRFRQSSQFDDLLRRIESQPGFSVETGDLWLPRFLFREPRPGDVFRMVDSLFGAAYAYRYGRVARREFVGAADSLSRGIEFSEEETKAYRQWHEAVVRREAVEKNPELRLQTRIRGEL